MRVETDSVHQISALRRYLPQVLASIAINLLSLSYGLSLAFPALVVPALLGQIQNLNPNETLHITAAEASWLVSVSFVGTPIGDLFGGLITEPIGRKNATLLVNVPRILGWLMLAYGNSVTFIYISFTLLGFSDGFMGIPLSLYISEISEPSIRGSLMATGGVMAASGVLATFTLGSFWPWRQVASIGLLAPIAASVAIILIPESPSWLISKRRSNKALKSLQWLRGIVPPQAVSNEFEKLKRHIELSKTCADCKKLETQCTHRPPTICEKFRKMKQKRTMKPFMMILILQFFMQFSGMAAMRPYIVLILNAHGIPLDSNSATIFLGLLSILALACLMLTIRWLGKRKIFLYSMVASFITYFALCAYGFVFFPPGWSSFDKNIDSNHIREAAGNWSYFAFAMILINYFFFCFGVSCIPNFLPAEVFPFELKSLCCLAVSGVGQTIGFVSTKTFYNLEIWLSLSGVICFSAVVCVIGFVAAYFILPETENRTLEDIELHFSDNNRRLIDIDIQIGTQLLTATTKPSDGPETQKLVRT